MSPAVSEVDCGGDIFQARARALAFLFLACDGGLRLAHVGMQQTTRQDALAERIAIARDGLGVGADIRVAASVSSARAMSDSGTLRASTRCRVLLHWAMLDTSGSRELYWTPASAVACSGSVRVHRPFPPDRYLSSAASPYRVRLVASETCLVRGPSWVRGGTAPCAP